jgi:hypothetical protein
MLYLIQSGSLTAWWVYCEPFRYHYPRTTTNGQKENDDQKDNQKEDIYNEAARNATGQD